MKIINNLNGGSHWDSITKATRQSSDLMIVSPFMDEIIIELVSKSTGPNLRSITIVTRIYDTPSDAFASASRLIRLLEWANEHAAVKIEIHENPKLHGKIYLTKGGSEFTYGLVGSANCTQYGLRLNHEWSVEITDRAMIESLWCDVTGALPRIAPLTRLDLERIKNAAGTAVRSNRDAVNAIKAMRIDLGNLLPKQKAKVDSPISRRPLNARPVWLKPVGDSKDRITPADDYWSSPHKLHFARRPVAVNVGDIIVAYATGWKTLVGVFEIIRPWRPQMPEELAEWPEGKRWPWVAESRPLTPRFSQNWYAENLLLEKTVDAYSLLPLSRDEKEKAAKVIPAIRARSDKVKLTPLFSQFIIDEIYRRDGGE